MAGLHFFASTVGLYADEARFWAGRREASSALRNGDPLRPAPKRPFPASSADMLESIPSLERRPLDSSLGSAAGPFRAFAEKHAPLLKTLPSACGNVRKISLPKNEIPSRVVLHVQDVHVNPDAQKNIGRALRALIEEKAVDLVALEGAFSPIDLRPYRAFPDKKIIETLADHLLETRRISGPIHAALTTKRVPPPVLGVDDPAGHRANVRAYQKSVPLLARHKGRISAEKDRMEREKDAVFNPELRDYDRAMKAFEERTASLGGHLLRLARDSRRVPPQTRRFLESLALETDMDFPQAEKERGLLAKALLARLDPTGVRALMDEGLAFRLGARSHGDFYGFLQNLCLENGVALDRFPAMERYVRYVRIADTIDPDTLFAELKTLETEGYARLARTDREKRLAKKSRRLWLTEKLLDFSLTPAEWKEYSGLRPPAPLGTDGEGAWDLSAFESFYREAQARDGAIARNLLAALEKTGARTAVLVTGGFHSAGITEILNAAGVASVSFTPRIEKIDAAGGAEALSVFAQAKTPLDKLFEGDKLFLAPDPGSVTMFDQWGRPLLLGMREAGNGPKQDVPKAEEQTMFERLALGTPPPVEVQAQDEGEGRAVVSTARHGAGDRILLHVQTRDGRVETSLSVEPARPSHLSGGPITKAARWPRQALAKIALALALLAPALSPAQGEAPPPIAAEQAAPLDPAGHFLGGKFADTAPLDGHYAALKTIPPDELFHLLEWRPDIQVQSFFSHVYKWWPDETHGDPTLEEFLNWAKGLSSEDMLKVARVAVEENRGKDPAGDWTRRVEEVAETLGSPEFKRELSWAEESLDLRTARRPLYEMYLIFKAPEPPIYLSVLKTEAFRNFHGFLKDRYGINPNNFLIQALEIYINPKRLESVSSAASVEAFQILKDNFPDVDFDISYTALVNFAVPASQNGATTLDDILESGEFKKKIRAASKSYRFLTDEYGALPASSLDLFELLSNPGSADKLKPRPVRRLWKYMRERYPRRTRFGSIFELLAPKTGFFNALANPLFQLETDPSEFDRFLGLFGANLGDIDLTGFMLFEKLNLNSDFESLAENVDFVNFLKTVQREYPQTRNARSLDLVAGILRGFSDPETFLELNGLISELRQRGGRPAFDAPECEMRLAREKILILRTMKERFPKISIADRPSGGRAPFNNGVFSVGAVPGAPAADRGPESIGLILKRLENGTADRLYEALVGVWGIKTLHMNDFLMVLEAGNTLLYSDTERARRFQEIGTLYKLANAEGAAIESLVDTAFSSQRLVDLVDDTTYEFLSREETLNIFRRYASPSLARTDGTTSLPDFLRFSWSSAFRDRRFPAAARKMEEAYGLPPKTIGAVFLSGNNPEDVFRAVDDPIFAPVFSRLKDFYEKNGTFDEVERRSPGTTLFRALRIKGSGGAAIDLLGQFRKMGIDADLDEATFAYFVDHVLPLHDFVPAFMDPPFIPFHEKVSAAFHAGVRGLPSAVETAELYTALKKDPRGPDAIFSEQFESARAFLRERFFQTELRPSTVLPLVRVAEDFDRGAMETLVARLEGRGEKVFANDLILLSRILKDPGLLALLSDRAALEKAVSPIYARSYSNRRNLDQAESLRRDRELSKGDEREKIEAEIERVEKNYTERPPLESLPTLFLIRAYLINQALEDPEVLAHLGSLVSRDIADKTTEFGGEIRFDDRGKVVFSEIHSHSESNGGYTNRKFGLFLAALVTFHFHALSEDNWFYSGPSGWAKSIDGDIPNAGFVQIPGVVITTTGRILRTPGKITVDVDIFGAYEREGEERALILDLGHFSLPFQGADVPQSIFDPALRFLVRLLERREWIQSARGAEAFRQFYNAFPLGAGLLETYGFLYLSAPSGPLGLAGIGFFGYLAAHALLEIVFDRTPLRVVIHNAARRAPWALVFLAPFIPFALPSLAGSVPYSLPQALALTSIAHGLRNFYGGLRTRALARKLIPPAVRLPLDDVRGPTSAAKKALESDDESELKHEIRKALRREFGSPLIRGIDLRRRMKAVSAAARQA